ncbi:hypothetical protein B0H19DRAFT_1241392 [Mycena capillaripes]|nr:hypothetical protein B0H19DRAFT_1241392 [Mycena capillaripes]
MESPQSRFAVQELVDHCIGFLSSSIPDLLACALVSRAWVYTAQRHLFKTVYIPYKVSGTVQTERFWWRLHDSLLASPHLIRHIHRLHITATSFSITSLSVICSFQFTHLDCVVFTSLGILSEPKVLALQRLLSLPSLRRAKIQCTVDQLTTFSKIWENFSPSIKRLELSCYSERNDFAPTDRFRPIALESLRIGILQGADGWLTNNFVGLKALSLGESAKVPWRRFLPALEALEALDVTITNTETGLNFAAFSRLALLRISVRFPPSIADSRSTFDSLAHISPSNHIRIVIHSTGTNIYDDLDSKLSSLPMDHAPVVALEMHIGQYELARQSFPLLTSKNMLRRTDHIVPWFEDLDRSPGS